MSTADRFRSFHYRVIACVGGGCFVGLIATIHLGYGVSLMPEGAGSM